MLNRISLAVAAVLVVLLAAGCRSSELFDTSVTTGRVSGELTIVGPSNTDIDLKVGLCRNNRDDTYVETTAGRLTATAEAAVASRTVAYDFNELPIGTYNLVLFSDDGDSRETYYRSGRIRLTYEFPEQTGRSEEASLTGPTPWGTTEGLLLLNGTRSADPVMHLYFVNADDHRFHYEFNAWDAGFGIIYFSVGGLAYGDYTVGISDPVRGRDLAELRDSVTISADEDAESLVVWCPYPDQDTTGDGYSIGGNVKVSELWSAEYNLAVVATSEVYPSLDTSPIYHILPGDLDSALKKHFDFQALSAGEYHVQLYALDFVTGNHQVIGEITDPIILDEEQPFRDSLLVWGDVSLLE